MTCYAGLDVSLRTVNICVINDHAAINPVTIVLACKVLEFAGQNFGKNVYRRTSICKENAFIFPILLNHAVSSRSQISSQ